MAIDIGTMLNQRFLLEKELGRGGMGAVYSATDQVLRRSVAIKVLKDRGGEEVGKKLRLEAQIAARLLHENVVRIYDFGQAEATYYLVMEEVSGTSYAKRWRHLAMEDRLRVLAQVAEALDYAHHQGVVHRDIKPGNVLMTAADSPKLSDFGLSILIERGDDSGVIRGTPLYMSPEQTRGTPLDFRSDLYSLGVMIYESAAGVTPFTGNSASVMSQHASTVPGPPRVRNAGISDELEALILSLLAKRPDDRPRSGSVVAEGLRREIDRIIGRDRPGGHRGVTTTQAAPRPPRGGQHRARRAARPRDDRGQRPGGRPEPDAVLHRADDAGDRMMATSAVPRPAPVPSSPTSAPAPPPGTGPRPRTPDSGVRRRRRPHGAGPIAVGPADARDGPGRPDPADGRGALPDRPLPRLPAERLAATRPAAAPAHGAPQRRPRPVAPGP